MVTPIGFGAAILGDMPETYGYRVDAARAEATINAIFAGPVTFLDVSSVFGSGRSERRIGAAIRERGLPGGFVISTKIDRDPASGAFDAARARHSIEESLALLGLKRIDLLFINEPAPPRSLGEARASALSELFRLKEEGLTKAVGLAVGNVDAAVPLLQDWNFDALMTHNRFTLVNRNAEALIDYAARRGVAVINAAPYAGGVLAKGASAYPSLRLSESGGGGARAGAPRRGNLRAQWRAAGRRCVAVLVARKAHRRDGVRDQPARACRQDS